MRNACRKSPDRCKTLGSERLFLECLLLPQSFGHPVEGCAELRDLVLARRSLERDIGCRIPRDLPDRR